MTVSDGKETSGDGELAASIDWKRESVSAPADKLVALETIRGIAAILVVFHHAAAAFAPRLHGLFDAPRPLSLFGTPLFALINGSAAVILFFVLSGFVLTLRLLGAPPRAVSSAAIKRWPRLMLPLLVVNLASGVLFALGLYFNGEAAQAADSRWLALFFRWPPAGMFEIYEAGAEGIFGVFLFGNFKYNSNIWSMYHELWGSIIVYLVLFGINQNHKIRYLALIILVFILFILTDYMMCFISGMLIAVFYDRHRAANWGNGAITALPVAFCLLGYHESLFTGKPGGFYALLGDTSDLMGGYRLRVLLHTIASVILIVLALKVPLVKYALSGRSGAFLGGLSYPIYLTHFLVIASLGSWTYLAVGQDHRWLAGSLAVLVSLLGSVATALPIMRLDIWWIRVLNRRIASLR
jgi:peptidoglycan/LPS O-acetylase OafA/YrhL